MIELHVALAVAAAMAAALTLKITPANAPWAHRLWLLVLASPVLWAVGAILFSPAVMVSLRPGVLPQTLIGWSGEVWSRLLWLYVGVAAALLLRTAMGVAAVRRLIGNSQSLAGNDLARLRALAGNPGLDIRSGVMDLPVTAGFLDPVVILPKGWRNISEGGLAAILRHEAAHVRRNDCLTALVCSVIEALAWFNPAVWLATSRVRWFAEMACDSDAARAMDGDVYASELLTLAAGWGAARRPYYTITAGAETGVARRIRLLLDEMEQGWRKRLLLPVAVLLLLIAIPLAARVRVGPANQPDAASGTVFSHTHGHIGGHGH